MTLSIKNGGYGFLIRLDLMLSMSLWKEFQLLQTLNHLSIKHLIKLILYGNDAKRREGLYRLICDIFEVWDFDYWYLKFSSSDSFPKLRPTASSISTFNYNLARFLCYLLSPLVPNDYSCKDTFSFVSQIKNANLSRKFLVFSDVTSLFTNIPLQENFDIAKKKHH